MLAVLAGVMWLRIGPGGGLCEHGIEPLKAKSFLAQ